MKKAKKVPNIITPPPGPEAVEWVERDEEIMASYNRPSYYPLVVAGGERAVVRMLMATSILTGTLDWEF